MKAADPLSIRRPYTRQDADTHYDDRPKDYCPKTHSNVERQNLDEVRSSDVAHDTTSGFDIRVFARFRRFHPELPDSSKERSDGTF